MKLVINGGKMLSGEIPVFGSKNAALPIIAATVLTKEKCVLKNIPRIGDVFTMLEILKSMGSTQRWIDEHTIEIENKDLDQSRINQKLVCTIRASIILIGPMLARFGIARLATPGGCQIGSRPLDTHFMAFRDFGVDISFDEKNGEYAFMLKNPTNEKVVLKELSVTATESLMMLGAKFPLTIRLAATEPHVENLGKFLSVLGVEVSGAGTNIISIKPAKNESQQIIFEITYDYIEMGTFAILGAATKSKLTISNVIEDQLDAVLHKLREMGVAFEMQNDKLFINGPAGNLKAAKIEARLYPGIPTDLQAPFGVLATQSEGQSLIFDTLYDGRLQYIHELQKMGAAGTVLGPHRAVIQGPTVLHGTEIKSLDLRAGATLLIAALIAQGESVIQDAELIDRGYEKLDERLRALGADIIRHP